VFLFGWLELRRQPLGLKKGESIDGDDLARETLVIFAAMVMSEWLIFRGFAFSHIDFAFVYHYLSWVRNERNLFILTYIAGLIKYGFPAIVAVIYLFLKYGEKKIAAIIEGLLFYAHLKLAILAVQTFWGALRTEEKLYELAATDMIFICCLINVTAATYFFLWLSQHVFAVLRPLHALLPRRAKARAEV
jgi:hypothetical protein